jgi:hypothetical protein
MECTKRTPPDSKQTELEEDEYVLRPAPDEADHMVYQHMDSRCDPEPGMSHGIDYTPISVYGRCQEGLAAKQQQKEEPL